MLRVETALNKQARSASSNLLVIEGQGDDEYGIGALRAPAVLVTEFQAGSARPAFGRVIGFTKRLIRRALRWYMIPITDQQSKFNQALLDVAEKMRASHERLEAGLASVRFESKTALAASEDKIDLMLVDLTSGNPGVQGDVQAMTDLPAATKAALEYRGFEDRHRGSFESTRHLLEPYVPLFRGCKRVLDIGCGRGEFLQTMRDESISAYGVDLDDGMVEAARERGLEVLVGDAIEHLRRIPSSSIDGIFCSQVAEHLKTSELMTLLDLCFRKLEPGGLVVFETPNPESLFIFHSFFYVDLTHIKPIHPEAFRWALEATGFADVRIERILPVPDGTRLEDIPPELAEEAGWQTIQHNVQRLNQVIYGPQHYSAIATKASDTDE
ncbi:MAG: class I SAM-dependent methyltransferase [Actinomycetota bacterium]|nr:class I SAM-dependent methyltransferase [Actinomycetota bacterium]